MLETKKNGLGMSSLFEIVLHVFLRGKPFSRFTCIYLVGVSD
uniref:Uncharacterized protein n=1 Tax=Lepeophtheirus salmonis TaxID=72036 RepID=A0A0K2VH01_LEPSM